MTRHLLPDEIDLLLDEAQGFGVAPLKAHVEACADCQARLDEAREVVSALDDLPHFVPSFRFADKVMADVPVFVPWHVAARESLAQWIPESRVARYAALGVFGSAGALLTVAIVWLVTRTDLLVFATGLAGDRLREIVVAAAGELVVAFFGQQALALFVEMGTAGLVGLGAAFLGAAALSLATIRRVALVSARRRG